MSDVVDQAQGPVAKVEGMGPSSALGPIANPAGPFKCVVCAAKLEEYPGYRCPKCDTIDSVVTLPVELLGAVAGGTGSVSFI